MRVINPAMSTRVVRAAILCAVVWFFLFTGWKYPACLMRLSISWGFIARF